MTATTKNNSGTKQLSPATKENPIVSHSRNPFITESSNSSPASATSPRINSNHTKEVFRSRGSSSASTASSAAAMRNPFHKVLHHHENNDGAGGGVGAGSGSGNGNGNSGEIDHKFRKKARSFFHIRSTTDLASSQSSIINSRNNSKLRRSASGSISSHKNINHNNENHGSGSGNNSSTTFTKPKEKIVYNPYGLINAGNAAGGPKNPSFYLEDEDSQTKNILPLPIDNPNDYLPDDLKQSNVDLLDLYDFPEKSKENRLGDGASSDVRIVLSKKNKNKKIAFKKFILFKKETPEQFYKRAIHEYIIAKNLAHGYHVVTTYTLLKTPTIGSMNRGWGLTLELCTGGDLFDLIVKKNFKYIPLKEKLCIFKQVAFGLKFMHEHDICHRDLKPENVLLTANGVVKLTDFGISCFGHLEPGNLESGINYCKSRVGSPPYAPPEMMALPTSSGKDNESNATSLQSTSIAKSNNTQLEQVNPFKMDSWGLGMLLLTLVYQHTPFAESSPNDENYRKYQTSLATYLHGNPNFKNPKDGPGPEFQYAREFQNKDAAYMCWRLIDTNQERRYSLADLFKNPFFEKISTCTDELHHLDEEEDEEDLNSTDYSTGNNTRNNSLSSSPMSKNNSRSMLDFSGVSFPQQHQYLHLDKRTSSVSSASSSGSNSTGAPSFNGNPQQVKSMLAVAEEVNAHGHGNVHPNELGSGVVVAGSSGSVHSQNGGNSHNHINNGHGGISVSTSNANGSGTGTGTQSGSGNSVPPTPIPESSASMDRKKSYEHKNAHMSSSGILKDRENNEVEDLPLLPEDEKESLESETIKNSNMDLNEVNNEQEGNEVDGLAKKVLSKLHLNTSCKDKEEEENDKNENITEQEQEQDEEQKGHENQRDYSDASISQHLMREKHQDNERNNFNIINDVADLQNRGFEEKIQGMRTGLVSKHPVIEFEDVKKCCSTFDPRCRHHHLDV
ncbi:hypothetical protein PACTADRAFT_48937 [Pachysolen tannophilus NRRL Y-2460]|uniref:Protein kinase domain-containing protein n=1 Tax=Pachysolen tannophilus NRRL Y-2460 TaxID=669874 RepID=A0A1E4TZU0_PACTA|nr:hypothetical protein PACTADRAFT_48937 [Pachysolen tannophilus NRRL Y-2460]